MVFESTVVYQRIRSMSELRKMAPKAYPINVYRGGAWISVPTSALLPGDICSLCTLGLLKDVRAKTTRTKTKKKIVRSQEDRAVPADMLLLGGSCIVNEAMLTGESTPQIKEPITERAPQDTLDIINRDKAHIVFGGTKIVQSMSTSADGSTGRSYPSNQVFFVKN